LLFESCSLSIISNEHWKGEIHTSYRPKHDPCVIIVIILELCGKPKTSLKLAMGHKKLSLKEQTCGATSNWQHILQLTHLSILYHHNS